MALFTAQRMLEEYVSGFDGNAGNEPVGRVVDMIRSILCPVDCSDCSRQALQVAVAVGRWLHARVSVLNVGPAVMIYPALVARVTPSMVATPTRAERALRVARFLQPHVTPHQPIDVILEEGDPGETIATAVERHAIDLVVIGTHGRSSLGRLAFGSVAEHVVGAARCPVLVIPPGAHVLPSFHGFTRVLGSMTTATSAYARLLEDPVRVQVTTLSPSESYDDILQAASAARPDLMVWDRERTDIGILVRKATVPILTMSTTGVPSGGNQQRERHAP